MTNSLSKKYIAVGLVVSNLIMLFIGAFLFSWYWSLEEFNGLYPMILIVLVTGCASVAGYFWSFTSIPLKSLRLLAIVNLLWIWILLSFQPYIGVNQLPPLNPEIQFLRYIQENFLYIFNGLTTLVIVVFCSLLGNWAGRRILFE